MPLHPKDENGDEYEMDLSDTLEVLVRDECQKVMDALRRIDEADLFASLWWSRDNDVALPPTQQAVAAAASSDIVANKLAAFEWINQGLPL